jgi:hypothetical protein
MMHLSFAEYLLAVAMAVLGGYTLGMIHGIRVR